MGLAPTDPRPSARAHRRAVGGEPAGRRWDGSPSAGLCEFSERGGCIGRPPSHRWLPNAPCRDTEDSRQACKPRAPAVTRLSSLSLQLLSLGLQLGPELSPIGPVRRRIQTRPWLLRPLLPLFPATTNHAALLVVFPSAAAATTAGLAFPLAFASAPFSSLLAAAVGPSFPTLPTALAATFAALVATLLAAFLSLALGGGLVGRPLRISRRLGLLRIVGELRLFLLALQRFLHVCLVEVGRQDGMALLDPNKAGQTGNEQLTTYLNRISDGHRRVR
mmetsp:Transcript_20358/g.51657  ORF Transcript_20358/g.51657 Transcript_20358/m.51657 type:complete len:276 (-) Transcript_20358:793-1620(-)